MNSIISMCLYYYRYRCHRYILWYLYLNVLIDYWHWGNSKFSHFSPFSSSQTNTYQAIIISDGAQTYTVFTYNCNELNWVGDIDAYASIGYSVLGNIESFRNFENHGLSRLPQVRMVACRNVPVPNNRPWSNLVYKIGVVTNTEQIARSQCVLRVSEDQERYSLLSEPAVFDPFFRTFILGLQDCPCTLFQAQRDFRFFFLGFSGENICYGSRFPVFFFPAFVAHRCCYSTFK